MRRSCAAVAPLPLALYLWAGGGCAGVERPTQALLAPPQMHADSVVLEVSFVRFPLGEAALNEALWSEVDEQQVAVEARQALSRQALRTGVLPGYLPRALEELLQDDAPPLEGMEATLVSFEPESKITTKHVQLRSGKRLELAASETYPRLTILEPRSDGTLAGRDFEQAECRFSLTPQPLADGRVRLQLVPEVQHGDAKPQLTSKPEMGLMVFETARPKRVFDELKWSVDLAPGDLLVLGTSPVEPGSLGAHYFTSNKATAQPQQKLLLIRLVQTQHDGALGSVEGTAG